MIDELIRSAKILMIAITALVLVYSTSSYQKIKSLNEYNLLVDVEIMSGAIALENRDLARIPLTYFASTKYLFDAIRYVFANTTSETYTSERLDALGFTEEHIPNATETLGIPMRTSLLGQCDFAEVTLHGEDTIILSTFIMEQKLEAVEISDLTAIMISGCQNRKNEEIAAIRATLDDGTLGYIIPSTLMTSVAQNSLAGLPQFPISSTEFKSGIPEFILQFVDLSEEYHYVSSTSVRALIIGLANTRSGRWFSQQEYQAALDSLFVGPQNSISWQGVVASITEFIRYSPIIMFILIWELWRVLRRLPTKIDATVFWLCSDAKDLIGLFGAFVYSSFPFVSCITVILLYVTSQGLFLDIFGYNVSPIAIATWTFPRTQPEFTQVDQYSMFLLVPGLVMLAVAGRCSILMANISRTTFVRRHRRTRRT